MSIVDLEVGMERQFFAVTADMVEALSGLASPSRTMCCT